jgi:hypothetical protein
MRVEQSVEDLQGEPKFLEGTYTSASGSTTNPIWPTRARTPGAALGSQCLTAWAIARPIPEISTENYRVNTIALNSETSIWTTLLLKGINTGTWPSRLGVGGVSDETVKYDREFCGTSAQEWLLWQGPEAIVQ